MWALAKMKYKDPVIRNVLKSKITYICKQCLNEEYLFDEENSKLQNENSDVIGEINENIEGIERDPSILEDSEESKVED